MQVICPKCGKYTQESSCCHSCKTQLEWVEACYFTSEKYYVKGYKYAKERKLTKAINCLKKSVCYNKHHVQAKNLLGLIYFEVGQVGKALKMWILSEAIQKEGNLAQYYMNYIQNQPKKLEHYKESIHLYNRALKYLNKKNDDMAVIRLKKAVHLNPNFLEARNLLTLCYIYQNQHEKALEQVQYTLSVDGANDKALVYLKAIEIENVHMESQIKKVVKSPNLNERQVDGKVKPTKVLNKGATLGRHLVYFIFGMVCMYTIETLLVVPEKTENLKAQVYQLTGENSDMKLQIDTLRKDFHTQILTLEEQTRNLSEALKVKEQENTLMMQKNRLLEVEEYIKEKEWVAAADVLYSISETHLGEAEKSKFISYKETVYPKATDDLYYLGYNAYKNRQYVEAMQYFEKTIQYGLVNRASANAIYHMGKIEEENGQINKAIQHYTTVVENFSDQEASRWSNQRIKQLSNP